MAGMGLTVIAAAMIWGLLVYYLLVGWALRLPGQRATVMTLYDPPSGVSPALAAYFLHPGDPAISLATCLVDLAERGSIRLKPVQVDGYYVEPADDDIKLQWWERDLRKQLVECTLSPDTVRDASQLLNSRLDRELVPRYISPHNFLFFLPVIIPVAVSLELLSLHLDRNVRIAILAMAGMCSWAAVALDVFQTKGRAWVGSPPNSETPDRERSPLPARISDMNIWLMMLVIGSLCLVAELAPSLARLPLITGFALANFLGRFMLRAPTSEGWELYVRLQGFRFFVSSVEADPINVANDSTEAPAKIHDHLAFALAFDVERSWGRQLLLFLRQQLGSPQEALMQVAEQGLNKTDITGL
jgi:hypothetical protein